MDTRFLSSFVAVVERGSIADAARHLDLAPTTVAQQVKALEQDFGTPLLTRSGRTVRPTEVGYRILERSREVLRDIRDLYSAASDTGLPAGPLRLGATPSALTGMLPPLMHAWMARHPTIAIHIEPGTSVALLQRVMAQELDVAILVHPAFDLPKTCGWRQLRDEALILLAPAGMAVDDPLATIAGQPFIRYDRRVVAGRLADDYLTARGIQPNARLELDGIEQIALLVAEGLGVSVLPDWPVIGPPSARYQRVPLPAPCPSRQVGLAWPRSSVRTPLADEFVRLAAAG